MIVCWIAYNGRKYHGFNIQPDVKTIEGEIIRVLKELGYIEDRKKARFRYASRTDAGVSALMNIISFESKKELDLDKINENLDDIYFIAYKKVNFKFNPRDAKYKWYKYFIKERGLDLEKMMEASKLFVGRKDFWGFCKPYRENMNTVREIYKVRVREWENYIVVDVIGKSFLWQMVRRIVNSLILIGKGKIEIEDIKRAFRREIRFDPAPPENLFLWLIKYDNFSFD